ncbi:OmpH family outer membrane protein [uncultured Cytophaga sp.]|uniref:OmpH family outer membrane protein n=1 Tax=uncultured Cytophaga sp. TaxID=160238 RepID=UPI0026316008|nr:OmpH family outer membrane protein [uncultured Cytophaga sp.]
MKSLCLALLLTLFSTFAWGQKFGYIDSEYIIKQMPEYKKAQTELNEFSLKWQKEIEADQVKIDKLREDYQAEEVLLTEDMRKERMDTIALKESKLRDLQKNYFGFKGLLFLKRQELVKPAQDKLFKAIEKVAKEKKLAIIFDKSGELVMVYTDPVHDYTDFVLEELGLGDKNDKIPTNK